MRCIFYMNSRPREIRISRALKRGMEVHGDTLDIRGKEDYGEGRRYEGPDANADLTIAYGVKSHELLKEHHEAGCPWAIVDKGYIRRAGPHSVEMWSRISVNRTYPELMKERPADRWLAIAKQAKVEVRRLRYITPGVYTNYDDKQQYQHGHIIVAGSSQKFYSYFEVGEEALFHSKLIRRLRKAMRDAEMRREIVFRPKPSYEKRERITDTYGAHKFSGPSESIHSVLESAYCLVTFASNAACDAIFHGVPVIVLGPHATKPIANHNLEDIGNLTFPSDRERLRFAHSLAYEMWTLAEMESGAAWEEMKAALSNTQPEGEWFSFKHWGGNEA